MMLPKQENLPLARRLAVEALRKTDLAERAARSGGRFEKGPGDRAGIGIRYLGRDLFLSFPEGSLGAPGGGSPLSPREEILVLHYLEKAGGTPLAGKWTSFAEVPGGVFYNPVFLQRCKAPLVRHFGEDPGRLAAVAAAEAAGEPWQMGDVGVRVPALPRVPLGLVLWGGDAEFPPEGNVLFDSTVPDYLPVEDMVILAETVVWKLIKKKNDFPPQSAQRTQS